MLFRSLHSTNSYIGIIDENSKRVLGRRFPDDRGTILNALAPYKSEITGVVVESTYNWYWLRQRSRLVAKRTAFKYMLQQLGSNQSGINLSNNKLEEMKEADVVKLFEEEEWVLHGRSLVETLQFLKQQIDKIERYVLAKMKREWTYVGLQSVPCHHEEAEGRRGDEDFELNEGEFKWNLYCL